jgi:SHAQKYF class myb-like DNA-binding protein
MDKNDSRKRSRTAREIEEEESSKYSNGSSNTNPDNNSTSTMDPRLFDLQFPKDLEMEFASAIFDLGLKHASPKILIPLMPQDANLNTEHIKSHLQKYRIHKQRSKEEFQQFYEKFIKDLFQVWESRRCWEQFMSANAQNNSGSHHSAQTLSESSSRSAMVNDDDIKEEESLRDESRQERLRKKIRQLVELEEQLTQSAAVLQQWKETGAQILQQTNELQREIVDTTNSLEKMK